MRHRSDNFTSHRREIVGSIYNRCRSDAICYLLGDTTFLNGHLQKKDAALLPVKMSSPQTLTNKYKQTQTYARIIRGFVKYPGSSWGNSQIYHKCLVHTAHIPPWSTYGCHFCVWGWLRDSRACAVQLPASTGSRNVHRDPGCIRLVPLRVLNIPSGRMAVDSKKKKIIKCSLHTSFTSVLQFLHVTILQSES